MVDEAPPTLPDNAVRWLLVQTAASLGRLWARLDALPSQSPMKTPVSQDITPPEAWLDVLPRNVALSGVLRAVILAQALLTDEAVSTRPLDRRRACLIVQHIQCGSTSWSRHTLAMARKLGVELAETVGKEMNGLSLHGDIRKLDGSQTFRG
ncbi:hypothetical protein KPL74_01985 [Bacillus sp. NP157]|nr:hypothetical protein KPL74_01985 [Bacillus sp. NP157]